MDFMDISRMRRTVRKFAPTPVDASLVEKILEAGRWAPTAVNAQPQRILVLDTPENLNKVREFCTFGWQKTYADLARESDTPDHSASVFYYGAPVVMVVSYDSTACWTHPASGKSSGATDATIVAVHMMMEATSLGLGTAWISYFDEDKARSLLGIPEDWQPVCLLYVGYPAEEGQAGESEAGIEAGTAAGAGATPRPPRRKPLAETCFFNSIDQGAAPAAGPDV